MANIKKNPDRSVTVKLFLKEEEHKLISKLAKKLSMNEFDVIKYCIQLVSWWSRNEIEPETYEL